MPPFPPIAALLAVSCCSLSCSHFVRVQNRKCDSVLSPWTWRPWPSLRLRSVLPGTALPLALDSAAPHCEKKAQKKYRTFLVNNLPRHSVPKEVRKFCTCFLWYFVQSLMDTTENMYRHSVLSPYSIFCAFSVLKHGIFSSDIWSSKVGSCLCCRSQMTLHFALWSYFTSFGPLRLNCETVRESLNALTGTFY